LDRRCPAIEVGWPTPPPAEAVDLLLAVIDDERPTAVEERPAGARVFFSTIEQRDRAAELVRAADPAAAVTTVSVPDGAWAERSQASVTPIRVGRIIVCPPWSLTTGSPEDVVVTIQPSMGFGTGHHASTRLCLELLQTCPLKGRSLLDVGTGSGVLAIAACRLGADRVVAVDVDGDALASARENVRQNQAEDAIELVVLDATRGVAGLQEAFDVVVGNLTGSLIERIATDLAGWVAPGGALLVSGFQTGEAAKVGEALARAGLAPEASVSESDWAALRMTGARATSSPSAPRGR
jgi:ribosomal protein L11 methyltransferase